MADLQVELAEEVASRINDSGGRAKAVQVNATDFHAMENLVRETSARTGRLDYMFNNLELEAGGQAGAVFSHLS